MERASTWSDMVEEGKKVHLVVEVLSSPDYFSARAEGKIGHETIIEVSVTLITCCP